MSELILETDRLRIRPFVSNDLSVIHRILDQAFGDGSKTKDPTALAERRAWIQWSILSETWLARLRQPPYGDRAVTLREDGRLIGAVGLVPLLDRFEQIPQLAAAALDKGYFTPEVGLFWAIDVDYRRRGYATEAARAMIEYAFQEMRLKRILAKTEYDNTASQAVMRKVGMTVVHNPLPDPPWLQVVGVLENPA